jgi:hypothetical protein
VRILRLGLGLWVLLLIAGPVLAQQISVDYDHKAPFSDYKTYAWLRPPQMKDPLMARQRARRSKSKAKGVKAALFDLRVFVVKAPDFSPGSGVFRRRERIVHQKWGFQPWGHLASPAINLQLSRPHSTPATVFSPASLLLPSIPDKLKAPRRDHCTPPTQSHPYSPDAS